MSFHRGDASAKLEYENEDVAHPPERRLEQN